MDDYEIKHRLMAMRKYLDVRARIDAPDFQHEVLAACQGKISSLAGNRNFRRGEDLLGHVAGQLGVRFEEVRSPADIDELKNKYLAKKEIGFGQLPLELSDPDVDALLLKRLHARDEDPDRWVAVLNLQDSERRCYWNKAHELGHRLSEPPQQELRFYRHRASIKNRVERIVDLVAADLAFFKPLFAPVVNARVAGELDWDIIESIRQEFAPTSSRVAITNAVVEQWPMPVILLTAKMRGRKRNLTEDRALRISVDGWNEAAKCSDVYFYSNMRVPETSPIYRSYVTGMVIKDIEQLDTWATSGGSRLVARKVFVSARPYSDGVMALMTLM